ncbi:methyltransferase domain-containing protein [Stagnimonas aquatica]|uniref:Methyltransferase domain-containing protein n=1 Tax=Stagnimonas aquatica TaxID=2689987 RepID=A0A3N0VEL4_9GAMM|nr:methyltransferase domain-containing protein [Stagnimonas aquatica]ROH91166.1 methyltransferase domain-containing protein [Stagnimonas aquatica]
MLSLQESTELCRLLADSSRQRLLLLLEAHALSAAELNEITGLAQSRVSTHLAKLKQAGLIQTERGEGAALYSARQPEGAAAELWRSLRPKLEDAQTRVDLERAEQVLRARHSGQTWAESVAGRMERHYSPGRTWETTAHALIGLVRLGRVLDLASGDGVLAELLAPRSDRVTCLDISETVLAAARRRLAGFANIELKRGDMHALPFADASAGQGFDVVFALHALAYSSQPEKLLSEAARVLKPGGHLVVAALRAHPHAETMRAYDHVNLGFQPEALDALLSGAGLAVESCQVTSQETRPPYFEVITAVARR